MRSHITRLTICTFLVAGLLAYLVEPVQGKNKSASFANWLNTVTKQHNDADLHRQIYELRTSGAELQSLLQQAARLVTQHNEYFNLPFETEENSADQISLVLFTQWTNFQTGSDMEASVPPGMSIKPLIQYQPDGYFSFLAVPGFVANDGYPRFGPGAFSNAFPLIPLTPSPMASGIAINAP
jgi:hypothetical protein